MILSEFRKYFRQWDHFVCTNVHIDICVCMSMCSDNAMHFETSMLIALVLFQKIGMRSER